MNPSLMQIVIDEVAFLSLSSDDVLDQDAAVERLEHIAAALKALSPVDSAAFLAFIEEEAHRAELSGDAARLEFLRSIPDHLGLTDMGRA